MKRELWNRCDICGRFISFADIENGWAVRELDTPDTHFTPETYETLCREHKRFHDYSIPKGRSINALDPARIEQGL